MVSMQVTLLRPRSELAASPADRFCDPELLPEHEEHGLLSGCLPTGPPGMPGTQARRNMLSTVKSHKYF